MKIIHTGPETYAQFVNMGLDVQRKHQGTYAWAFKEEAWALLWRPGGTSAWREVQVGDSVDIYDVDLPGEELTG